MLGTKLLVISSDDLHSFFPFAQVKILAVILGSSLSHLSCHLSEYFLILISSYLGYCSLLDIIYHLSCPDYCHNLLMGLLLPDPFFAIVSVINKVVKVTFSDIKSDLCLQPVLLSRCAALAAVVTLLSTNPPGMLLTQSLCCGCFPCLSPDGSIPNLC